MTPNDSFFFFHLKPRVAFPSASCGANTGVSRLQRNEKCHFAFFTKTNKQKWLKALHYCLFLTLFLLSGGVFSTFRECVSWSHRVATPCQVFPVKPCLFSVSREVELESVWTCHDVHILNITQQRRTLQVFSLRSRWIFNCDITWSNIMSFILRKMFFTE